MSTKKNVKKSASVKKIVAKKSATTGKAAAQKKTPVKKAAATKSAPVKKAVSAKKAAPVKKAASAKKPVSAKKTAQVKKVAVAEKAAPRKKPVAVKKQAAVVKKSTVKKVVHVAVKKPEAVKKTAKTVLKGNSRIAAKKEEPVNPNHDFAFSFAEQMKKAQRVENANNNSANADIKLTRRPDTRVKGKNTQKFPDAILAQFKKSLLQLRQAALGQSVTLRNVALEQTEERGGEDEDGSDAFLRLQNLSQVDSQNRIIQKIDEALARIKDGSYGVCEHCGQLIRKARLLNLPFVHTCMECQTDLEQR